MDAHPTTFACDSAEFRPGLLPAGVARLAVLQRLVTFLLVSIPVFACWTVGVDSERDLGRDARGQPVYDWSNFGRMVDGTAPGPFVKRRILPDATRLVLCLAPDSMWKTFDSWVHANSLGGRCVGGLFAYLNWRSDRYSQLVVGYVLIWLSLIGFMYSAAHFAGVYYATSRNLATTLGCLLGAGLLGGSGPGFGGFTYDIPNAFLFLCTLYAIVTERRWMPIAFLAAVYSKETSCLLVMAYAIFRRNEVRSLKYWLALALMSSAYIGITATIAMTWNNPPPVEFWFPIRNVQMLGQLAVCNCWYLAFASVGLVRFYMRIWPTVPADLKWLLLLGVVLVSACFFKGIIEERRDYLEVYPICALMLFQWGMAELGLQQLFLPRRREAALQPSLA